VSDWGDVIITVVPSVLAGGGIVALINAMANRPKIKADATEGLTDTAVAQVKAALDQMKAVREDAEHQIKLARNDAERAVREAAEARLAATQAWAEAAEARREAMFAVAALRQRDLAILSPYATLESLREMVKSGPNGFSGMVHPT